MASSSAFLLFLEMVAVLATADNYVPSPVKPPYLPKPNLDIAIKGHIFCKSGYETYPIQGAKVKIACPIVDSIGKLVAKVTILSHPTDSKGHFYLITYGLSNKVKNINDCKVKLESSPISTCKIPTNVNKGVTGASLSSNNYKFLSHEKLNLYTLEPFYFSSPVVPKPVH